MAKTKIILDADVIIHFAKGGMLNMLPNILNNYDYVVLDTVYDEIKEPLKTQLDNQINLLKNINVIEFTPTGDLLKEFATLTKTLGRGESACMVYCRYNNDVVGSSNLKDIKSYCTTHRITYFTTIDFLYYAIKKGLIDQLEAGEFIRQVRLKGSILPSVDFSTFVCAVYL